MKFKVGDKVRVREDLKVGDGFGCTTVVEDMLKYRGKITTIKQARSSVVGNYTIYEIDDDGKFWAWTDEMLELFTRSKFKAGDRVRIKDTGDWDSDIITIGETGTIIEYSISDKVYRVEFDNYNTFKHDCGGCCRKGYGWNCEEKMLEPAYAEGGYVPYHKIPTPEKPISIEEQFVKDTFKDRLDSAFEAWRKLGGATSLFHENTISIKEDKPMKFTFYTEEGYRIDKSNNSKVETITTFVKINGFDNTYLGMATCDKVDYLEREGVINALANAMCNGNFDREFNKAVKDNARADKKKRTCTYCGQLFDTVEEKQAHEAWHVERKKARRERYLLRKRAKEIAFEEQAQKMAKEIIAEDNKK